MKHFKYLIVVFGLLFATQANAQRFWVGGTGTWDSTTTTHWSTSSGGAGGASVPGSGDSVNFDGNSGGGTVTASATISGLTFQSLVCGAFTGTLDFSVNNPSITVGVNGGPAIDMSGTGTRTIKLGSGTFTLKAASNNLINLTTTTGLTYDTTSTATFNVVAPGGGGIQQFNTGSFSFTNNTVNVTGRTDGSLVIFVGGSTFKSLTVSGSGSVNIEIPSFGTTLTFNSGVHISGSSTLLTSLINSNYGGNISASAANIAVGATSSLSWTALMGITFTTSTTTATNSFDLGANSGVTITPPSGGGGGGGHIIGG
jgi:hypothetical protein